MNRLSGGKNRRKTKNRNPRISIITNNKAYYKNKNHRINTKRTTLRYNKVYAFLFLLVCIFCVLIMNNKADLFAYFTNYEKIINVFSINAEYKVKFNKNTGTGSMGTQTISYNVTTPLDTNSFTKEGYSFDGWNTDPNGEGTSYTDEQSVINIGDTILYAQWRKKPIRYAVQIYGINQDEDLAGNSLGLTFGPATGANYNNSYVTHEYEEITGNPGNYYVKIITHTVASDGTESTSDEYLYENGGTTNKVTRTTAEKNKYDINMHEMTWAEIAAVTDKTAFLDCMLCGDTKSVSISFNNTLATSSSYTQYGDGAGTITYSIKEYYKKWNPSSSDNSYVGTGVTLNSDEQSAGSNAKNDGAYGSSHIRATLVGENSKTNKGYAGDENLTSETCIYSCIESNLQDVITAKKVKYVTGTGYKNYSLNDDISDKIWLFSSRELFGTGDYSGLTTEGLGISGDGYDRFENNYSKHYISSYTNNELTYREVYTEMNSNYICWLRSPYLGSSNKAYIIDRGSITNNSSYVGNKFGISFGFCIDTVPVNYTVVFNSNSGSGMMEDQPLRSNEPTALTLNSFTKVGYEFTGWNTNPDGTGTSYTDGQMVSKLSNSEGAIINLYAQWKKIPVKYAVQIYGINQDQDSEGNSLGLTFGPAVGANYNNSYVTHEYEEITGNPGNYYVKIITHTVAENGTESTSDEYLYENGGTTTKVTRTTAEKNKYDINMHEMTWAEIATVADKTAFLDCMLCGDTKSVTISLNNTLATSNVYNQYGDGVGLIFNSINTYYRKWNPNQSDNSYVGTGVTLDNNEQNYGSNAKNAGGYSSSHIRATLVGEDSKTNKGYAGDVNLSSSNSLYTCIESDLKNVITAKKVKYVTGSDQNNYSLNDDISDKIWLFSEREMYGTGKYTGTTTEGIGTSGVGYDKFGNNESKYYISSYSNTVVQSRVAYYESGLTVQRVASLTLLVQYVRSTFRFWYGCLQ